MLGVATCLDKFCLPGWFHNGPTESPWTLPRRCVDAESLPKTAIRYGIAGPLLRSNEQSVDQPFLPGGASQPDIVQRFEQHFAILQAPYDRAARRSWAKSGYAWIRALLPPQR